MPGAEGGDSIVRLGNWRAILGCLQDFSLVSSPVSGTMKNPIDITSTCEAQANVLEK